MNKKKIIILSSLIVIMICLIAVLVTVKNNRTVQNDTKQTQAKSSNDSKKKKTEEKKQDKEENKDEKKEETEEVDDGRQKYTYGKYTIKQSLGSTEVINFWFGRNTDFARPNSALTDELASKYNSVFIGKDEKVIYLTFDEGIPISETENILNVLKQHKVKGTFFLTKGFIESNPDLCKRMKEEGHLCGNHTSNHPNMAEKAASDPTGFIQEIVDAENIFKEKTGYELDKVFRFPEGSFNEAALDYMNQMGYRCVFWSFAYVDWTADGNTKEQSLNWMKNYYHNGAIYLLHAVSKGNSAALDDFITFAEQNGFKFDKPDSI